MQRRLQPIASRPEGPAAPLVCRAAELIIVASRGSNITGWTSVGSEEMMTSGEAC